MILVKFLYSHYGHEVRVGLEPSQDSAFDAETETWLDPPHHAVDRPSTLDLEVLAV